MSVHAPDHEIKVSGNETRRTEANTQPQGPRVIGYLLALAICALWGSSFVLTKVALGSMGPMAIAFVRWTISALALMGWIALRGRLTPAVRLIRSDGLLVIWLALAGVTLFYALENIALSYTTATNAGILSNLTAVFMVLIAVIWFGEHLTLVEWLALGIAFAGAAVVSQGSGHLAVSGAGLRGDLLMVLATAFGALYSLQSKHVTGRYPADVVTAVIAAAGAMMLLPLALAEGINLALPLSVWGSLILLGLGAGALGNLWWLHLLSYMDASRVGMLLFLVPLFSTVLAVFFLHERFTLLSMTGTILVFIGVAVMQRKAETAVETLPEASEHAIDKHSLGETNSGTALPAED